MRELNETEIEQVSGGQSDNAAIVVAANPDSTVIFNHGSAVITKFVGKPGDPHFLAINSGF